MNDTQASTGAAAFDPSKIGRFCDVIMKGGVTSGVVYPPAICHLASKYLLRNIGGTSVGAIAAVLAAAAEYRRRVAVQSSGASGDGYVALSKLPSFLTQDGAMLRLFAADPVAAGFLRVALSFVGSAPLTVKLAKVAGAILSDVRYALLAAVLIVGFAGIFYAAWHGSIVALLAGLLVGIAATVTLVPVLLLAHCVTVLATNDFGWCHGFDAAAGPAFQALLDSLPAGRSVADLTAGQTPRLFDWLDAEVQYTAGLSRTRPLTFNDLKGAPLPSWYPPDGQEGIGFRVMTTCLTLGRPFSLPFNKDSLEMLAPGATAGESGLFFDPRDFEKYFPPHVVNHMMAAGGPACKTADGNQLFAFPMDGELPVVVAVRMSMSFPVLFCALRLYGRYKGGAVKAIWFSDGGLSSNFPIQFFDSPLPRWPTFALDLLGGGTEDPARDIFLESGDPVRADDVWSSLEETKPLPRLLAFGSAMLDAMRTWHDTTLGRLPGNLSRTIGVCLAPAEGGINLNMTTAQIQNLLKLGDAAGQMLVNDFGSAPDTDAWQTHRWIRYRATMKAAADWLDDFKDGYAPVQSAPAQAPYAALIEKNVQPSIVAQSVDAATQTIASAGPAAIENVLTGMAPDPVGELHISAP